MKHADVIAKLSLREKCALLSGATVFETHALPNKGVPAIWLSDGPNGLRKQAGPADHLGLNPSEPATCFPTAATVANSWDPALGEEIGKALGEETASYSVNVILGPGLNTKRSPLCGRDFEYFSEDPYLSGKLAAGYVRGIQSVGVSACPKHFAANNQELRRMASNSVLDERTLRELYLTGFEIAVKEGRPKCIMTSYNRVNGTYANENHHLLQDILHGEWGYDGAVVTDWGGSNDHVEGVREGSTLEMPCPGFGSAKRLMQAVAEGRLPESAVDARVDELLELVFTTDAAVKAAPKRFDRDAHHALARRAAAESVVLLKNEDDLLPLKPGQRVALIGDFAQTPRYQGAGSSSVNATRVDNLKDAAEADDITLAGFCAGYERSGTPNPAFVEEAAALARKADVVVLCMGLDESSESEGLDRSHICIPENQKQLLEAVAQANENLVVVLSAGSVVETGWVSRCKAVLHAYLGGQAGAGAIMDVLTGRVNPSGKLAETLPLTYEDTPAARYFPGKQQNVEYREGLYIGYRYYETAHVPVRYPFGYGLSYTSFDWKVTDAAANGSALTKDGNVTVKVAVTNTGDRAGKDVVQLYYTAPYTAGGIEKSSVELGAFAKTKELAPGESEEVTLTVPVSDMASYDAYDANHNGFTGYELDAGDYIFTVRHDAHDVDDDANATITCSLPAGVQYAEDTATGNAVSNKFTGSDAIDGVSLDGSDSDQNITYLTRADFAGTFPKTNTPTRAMTDNVKALNLYTADDANGWINDADEAITTGAKNGLKIEDNGETTDLGFRLGSDFNDPRWDALLDQLTVDEMENLYINAYGGLAELKSVGKSKSKDADGPAQIGGFTGMGAGTGFPSSSTLAQTWNADLAQEEGRTIGTQALQNGYTGWYAPATNMHRSPFNGRNYEYYSEDSLLSGVICGNTVTGANQAGVYTYVKHFICNDGESGIYRDSVYTWMTEQTLRETYLRPFQMLVEDYDAVGLMSSYNRIGAVWAGGSEALLTGILRDEWGFDGAVITDYCDHHSYMNGDQALRAGGSLWMAGFTGGEMAFETGSNSYLQALRRATKEALYMYLHVRVTNRDYADSIGDTTAVRHAFTTSVFGWRHLVALIDIVAVVLFAIAVRGVVIDGKLRKAAKTEKKNS